jgi:hypothetical protein
MEPHVLEHIAVIDLGAIVQFLYDLAQHTAATLIEW